MNTDCYAVYLTVATEEHAVGYVVNNIVCPSGVTPTVPSGQAAVADPDRQYPIGSTYDVSGKVNA